jgi:hypothetical protein
LLQYLEDRGSSELVSSLEADLLECGDEYDFGADLETQLVQLRRDAMAERSRSAVAGIDSTSQLSDDARELLRGTSVNLEPTGN